VAGISHEPEPAQVEPLGQQPPSLQSISPASQVYPQPPFTSQYTVPAQHPALQHALGVVVTEGPQHPPGEQIHGEPSAHATESAAVAVVPLTEPRCTADAIEGPPRVVPDIEEGCACVAGVIMVTVELAPTFFPAGVPG
jgi:hypothetical protein